MAIYHHIEVYREFPGGDGLNGVTCTAKLRSDGSTITSDTSATVDNEDGVARLDLSDSATSGESSFVLHPGPYYVTGTAAAISVTRTQSSTVVGSTGPLNIAALHMLARAIGNGIISSPGQSLNTWAVTAAGAARVVTVATGAATIQGLTVWNNAARTIDISANASGNARIDTVVIEVIPAGNATEGRCVLKVVEGTPAASPVAPTLTQSTTAWQLPLADVAVANGASVISTGNLTDRRDYVERSTTTVEADLVTLEGRVDDLEAAAIATPRVDLVAYYQAAYDPAAAGTNSWSSTTVTPTFANGYSSILTTDNIVANHSVADGSAAILPKAVRASDTTITYHLYNNFTTTVDISSGTLTILVYRLVLA